MQEKRERERALGLEHVRRMWVVLLGQPEWGLGEEYGCPPKYEVWSRGSAGVMFLASASIFSY